METATGAQTELARLVAQGHGSLLALGHRQHLARPVKQDTRVTGLASRHNVPPTRTPLLVLQAVLLALQGLVLQPDLQHVYLYAETESV